MCGVNSNRKDRRTKESHDIVPHESLRLEVGARKHRQDLRQEMRKLNGMLKKMALDWKSIE